MTAHEEPKYRQLCREAGMNDYLVKPLSVETLDSLAVKWLPGFSPKKAAPSKTSGADAESGGNRESRGAQGHNTPDEGTGLPTVAAS